MVNFFRDNKINSVQVNTSVKDVYTCGKTEINVINIEYYFFLFIDSNLKKCTS